MNQSLRSPLTQFPRLKIPSQRIIMSSDRATFGTIPENPSRIQQLDNPFKPNDAQKHNKVISNIFQFNDRHKMRLTDSRVSESDQEEQISSKVTQQKNQFHRKQISKCIFLDNLSSQHPLSVQSSNIPQQGLSNTQKQQLGFICIQNEMKSKINEKKEKTENEKLVINIDLNSIDKSFENSLTKHVQEEQEMEEPIDEDLPEIVTNYNLSKQSNFIKTSKVALPLAFSVQNSVSSNVSFIDKIRQQSQIIQSRALEDIPEKTGKQKEPKRKRMKIFGKTRKQNNIQNNNSSVSLSPSRNRSPIFSRRSPKSPSRIQTLKHYQDHLPTNTGSPGNKSQQRTIQSRMGLNGADRACPHTLCILKSLQIIDKLTDVSNGNIHDKNDKMASSRLKKFEQICSSVFEVSLKLDNFITQTKITDLKNQSLKKQIESIADQVQRLMRIIRDEQYFANSPQISRSQQVDPIGNLKIMYQQINCLRLIQKRYILWEDKLKKLTERLSDVFKIRYQQQVEILKQIRHIINELRDSYIFCQNTPKISPNLFRQYNQYIEKESIQLEETLSWIKSQIFRAQG